MKSWIIWTILLPKVLFMEEPQLKELDETSFQRFIKCSHWKDRQEHIIKTAPGVQKFKYFSQQIWHKSWLIMPYHAITITFFILDIIKNAINFLCLTLDIITVFVTGLMGCFSGVLVINTLYILIHGASSNISNDVYFTSTAKPLQCHEIKRIYARSTVECALRCSMDIYPCVGSVNDRDENIHFQCDICFIYDVDTPFTTINAHNSTVTSIPEINSDTGKILT